MAKSKGARNVRSKPDYYADKAKKEGYAARSAYKLMEIHEKYNILHKGAKVLDLGASPGSWMQVASQFVGKNGLVVGIDLQELKIALADNMRFLQGDIFQLDESNLAQFASAYDIILSDMAPRTMGVKDVDAARSYALCQEAAFFASTKLKQGGSLVMKIFESGFVQTMKEDLKLLYEKIYVIKPKSSRKESVEIFLLAKNKQAGNNDSIN